MKINKLKQYKSTSQREASARNRQRSVDPELIERIVNQELLKYRKSYAKEKENIINSYTEEIKRREQHIKMITESLRHFEVENKSLMDIIYAKDREIQLVQAQIQETKFVTSRNLWNCRKINPEPSYSPFARNTYATSSNSLNSQSPKSPFPKHKEKELKRRLRNINDWIKDLEQKYSWKYSSSKSIEDKIAWDLINSSSSHHEEDLVDLEFRMRQKTPDGVRTQKQTPNQASGSESRTQYRSRALYVSPMKEETNLRSYLTNKNLDKNNNSFELSNSRHKTRESILQPKWSAIKQHASTSRISTCPRFYRERSGPLSSDRSSYNAYRKYESSNRRSIYKSMNWI